MDLRVRTIGPWWEVTLRDRIDDGVASSPSSSSSSPSSSSPSSPSTSPPRSTSSIGDSSSSSSSSSSPVLLARAVGVTALGICHLDSLVVSTRRARGAAGLRTRPGLAGTGGLMARAVFACAFERGGAARVEALAVDDGASGEHDRLVRAYRRVAGFEVVRRVRGDRVGDVPHQLVWGAVGSRMDARVEEQLRRWGSARARSKEKRRKKEEEEEEKEEEEEEKEEEEEEEKEEEEGEE